MQESLEIIRERRADALRFAQTGTDEVLRRPIDPALSPLGWHVGHSFFVESYWLQEVVFGDDRHTAALHALYFPEQSSKANRGERLPDREQLINWCLQVAEKNDRYWQQAEQTPPEHELLKGGYLAAFLAQHYAQHLETLQMVNQALAPTPTQTTPLIAEPRASTFVSVPAATTRIGNTDHPAPYDNEVPACRVELDAFEIAVRPVSRGQWLAFMEDDGYHRNELWDAVGQRWRDESRIEAPLRWQHGEDGWHAGFAMQADTTSTGQAVDGISLHEARAFARWCDARLPHEYEWEYAMQSGLLKGVGQAWEWCDNALHPYPGFRAFPYDGYSTPWFDDQHFVLRGGSRHTRPEIRRSSFRNFYCAEARHIFAGLRLAR